MERDIREFLRGFSVDELVRREVLAPWGRYGYVLQGRHVASLMRLMQEQGVTKLTYAESLVPECPVSSLMCRLRRTWDF